MAGDVRFDFPTTANPTTSLIFRASHVVIMRKRPAPNQAFDIAIGGREYILETSANIEVLWEVDFQALPRDDLHGFAGYTSLDAFIQTTLNWHENTFEITDTTGESLIVRYVSGLPNLIESGGRNQPGISAGHYFGTMVFRKTL